MMWRREYSHAGHGAKHSTADRMSDSISKRWLISVGTSDCRYERQAPSLHDFLKTSRRMVSLLSVSHV